MPEGSPRFVENPMRVPTRHEPRLNFARAFHARLPSFEPTPCLRAEPVAHALGVSEVWLKDETGRLGLPSYEILGAGWAIYRAAMTRLGSRPRRWHDLDELTPQFEPLRPLRVVTVTDSHFGLAVARAARLLGFDAVVYLPETAAPERAAAIRDAGAEVVSAGASYDDALARATIETATDDLVVADSSWGGFEEIPDWVTEGYVTVFEELGDRWEDSAVGTPDAVLVPMGTGSLAAAAGEWFRSERFPADLDLVGVEAVGAPCFAESVVAGERRTIPDPAPSVMSSLARGLPSPSAFETVAGAFDGFVAVDDVEAREAVRLLEAVGLEASPSGAAALAGAAVLVGDRFDSPDRLAVIVSEGRVR